MSDSILKVENLGKKYYLRHQQSGRYTALRDVLAGSVRSFGRRLLPGNSPAPKLNREEFWALKDVSFEVNRGEAIGIIGRNGAGKSTLLKVLSRITKPTTGRVAIKGRVASLLEVGTGFHPELTGRENIYLNGAILGMTRADIRRKFDEIVDFAEVERFLDTPVKRYSSGMYVRLAFAVAAHLEPEILVVDEVLAVGDAAFQKKCLGKMSDVSSQEGRTVLFVSHNMQAISSLTKRSIVLSHGKVIYNGNTEGGINEYIRQGASEDLIYVDEPSSTEPRVTRVEILTSEPNNTHVLDEPLDVLIELTTPIPIDGAAVSFQIYNSLQVPVIHILTLDSEIPMCREPGVYRLICRIPKLRLYIGHYHFKVHFSERFGGRKFSEIDNICPFEVIVYEMRDYYWYPNHATYIEDYEWDIGKIAIS